MSKFNILFENNMVDEWACHKRCGEFWTNCQCDEVLAILQDNSNHKDKIKQQRLEESCYFCGNNSKLISESLWFFPVNPHEGAKPTCIDCVEEEGR